MTRLGESLAALAASRYRLLAARRLIERGMLMSAQTDIDAAVAALDAFLTNVSEVAAELANGETAVDTSKLNAVVAQLPAVQAQVDALAPASTTTTKTTAPTTTHTTTT